MIYLRGSPLYSQFIRYFIFEREIIANTEGWEWYRGRLFRQDRSPMHLHPQYHFVDINSSRSDISDVFETVVAYVYNNSSGSSTALP